MTRLPCELGSPATTERKRQQRICVVAGCTTAAGERKAMCNKCHDRAWRAKYPEHHIWNNLKKSAKRRGLEFTITREWFVGWCEMTGFAELCGRTKGCASIDRIKPWLGYECSNIRMLEVGANSARGQDVPPINSDDGPVDF